MLDLSEREIWQRYRNRERIPIGILASFAADDHNVSYGKYELMRISYDGLWALYYGSIWTQSEQSMKLVRVAFTDQLGKYFEKLGISTKVLDPLKSLSQPIRTKRNSNNINRPKHIDKESPFCKVNDGVHRSNRNYVVEELPHYVDPFYVTDLIEAYDLKEEILFKTRGL